MSVGYIINAAETLPWFARLSKNFLLFIEVIQTREPRVALKVRA